jgi:hypothetical protein
MTAAGIAINAQLRADEQASAEHVAGDKTMEIARVTITKAGRKAIDE